MVKKYILISFFAGVALFINSCSKEPLNSTPILVQTSCLPVDSVYDNYIANLALGIHQSLDDSQFTKTLRNEIMQRPDGDYEVILKSFINNNIDLSNTALFKSLVSNVAKGTVDNEKYPKLQIAIPVNAEKWDGSSKLWVLYLPSNFDEFSTKEVPAISPQGVKTMFNVEKQPDFPVIVIGQNERSNENGDLKFVYNLFREKVKFNILAVHPKNDEGFTSFSATPVTNAMAVNLDWTFIYPDYLEPYDHYVEIYRDDLLGSGFQKIGEADSWQSFYYDTHVLPTRTYAYYVVARVDIDQTYNHNDYEEYFYSESANAALPQIPTFTSNFAVECISPNIMQLTWTINNISNWTNLSIERYTSYNPTPVVIAQLPITAISYQDNLGTPNPSYGISYRYTLKVSNVNTGAQQAYYCDEMLSNRINYQALKVTRIQFNSFDDMRRYESWLNGAPEIMLSVNKVVNGTASTLCSNVQIGGPA